MLGGFFAFLGDPGATTFALVACFAVAILDDYIFDNLGLGKYDSKSKFENRIPKKTQFFQRSNLGWIQSWIRGTDKKFFSYQYSAILIFAN
jgi:hypothetical protein